MTLHSFAGRIMQKKVRPPQLKRLTFITILFLLGATLSLSNCKTLSEPTQNQKQCAQNHDITGTGVQTVQTYEQANGCVERLRKVDPELRRQIMERSAKSSAKLLIAQAEDVSASIKNARIYCEEIKVGWLDIEVEILSGPCEPDCVASSLFLQGWFPRLTRPFFFRAFQERDSFENYVFHPEVYRGTSVMRVDFAADGKSIDSSVVLEEKRGGFDTESWFTGMAESAELDNPVGDECAVRVIFKANLAYFTGHYNHR